MAAPLAIKHASGQLKPAPTAAPTNENPVIPYNERTLVHRIEQLTNTLNELIKHFNAHQHSALNAAPATDLHTGAGATAQNLFTAF